MIIVENSLIQACLNCVIVQKEKVSKLDGEKKVEEFQGMLPGGANLHISSTKELHVSYF